MANYYSIIVLIANYYSIVSITNNYYSSYSMVPQVLMVFMVTVVPHNYDKTMP